MNPIVIGVCGGTGSGKTTVVQVILERVGAERIAYIQHDSYYRDQSHLPLEERARVNYDHPDSLETELLVKHAIAGRTSSGGACIRFHHAHSHQAHASR